MASMIWKKQLNDCHIFSAFNHLVRLQNVKQQWKQFKEKALEVIGSGETEGKTFKVEIRRTDKSFPFVTNELQQEIGSHVLQ